MKIVKCDVLPMDTYWFPAEDGLRLEDVTVTVHWSPYSDEGALRWVIAPFRPFTPFLSAIRPVTYPGRSHATTKREAGRIARELFTSTYWCLTLDHDECPGALGSRDDYGGDPPACTCRCHKKKARR